MLTIKFNVLLCIPHKNWWNIIKKKLTKMEKNLSLVLLIHATKFYEKSKYQKKQKWKRKLEVLDPHTCEMFSSGSFNLLAMPFIAGKANLNWFIKSPFIQFKHLLNVMETARSALKWYELINMLIRRYIFLHILAICRIRAHTMKILLTIFLSVHDNSLHHKHQTVKRVFPI